MERDSSTESQKIYFTLNNKKQKRKIMAVKLTHELARR